MNELSPHSPHFIRNVIVIAGVLIAIAVTIIVAHYSSPSATSAEVPEPAAFSLPVPYTTQAPTGDWLGNEDCEEASITMANAYLTGDTTEVLPTDAASTAIDNLVEWEQQNFGYNANTGAEQTATIAESVDKLNVQIVDNYTEDQMKQALLNHKVILLMVNAQELHNPNYGEDAPTYHVVVVYGYDGGAFLIHDPGTETGESNKYTYAELYAAGADWNNTTNTLNPSRKVALFLSK